MSNLKQIGLGISMYADQHGGRMPATLDQLKGVISNEKVFQDVESGDKFTYVGGGRTLQEGSDDSVVAYSLDHRTAGGNVLFNDGHVEWKTQIGDVLGRATTPQGAVGTLTYAGSRGGSATRQEREMAAPQQTPASTESGRTRLAYTDNSYAAGNKAADHYGMTNPAKPPQSNTEPLPPTTNAAVPVLYFNDASGDREIANRDGTERVPVIGGVSAIGHLSLMGSGEGRGYSGRYMGPMVAGIRPIRIDIPKSGTRFVFTKVLNIGKDPLAVRAMVMEDKVFKAVRGAAQALVFVAGLMLLGWQFRERRRAVFLWHWDRRWPLAAL